MLNTSLTQYFPISNQNIDPNMNYYSKVSVHSANNNETTSNSIFQNNIIQRKNSAILLTAHNYQMNNMIPSFSQIEPINLNNNNYDTPLYTSRDRNISPLGNNYLSKVVQNNKRYHSSENLNFSNLPKIAVLTEKRNNVSVYKMKPSNEIMHCKTNNNIILRNTKRNVLKIPHPKFSKKNIPINNFKVLPNNNLTTIYFNQNFSNNIHNYSHSALNDSINSFTNNYLNNSNSFNNSVLSDNLNQTFSEEPDSNFNLSELTFVGQIGNGSEGSISRVKWQKNYKTYALKKCEIIYDEEAERRKKDILLIKDFMEKNGSDGIIKIYGILCIKNQFATYYYYELMELADRDWEKEIKIRQKSLQYYQEYELMEIFKHLIKTLSLLQSMHYTHRDIKPQNIMIVNGKYKICDFGNGKLLKRDGLIVQRIRGSELYMSPIIFKGFHSGLQTIRHNTFKSDVFSLGMCFFYAAALSFGGLNVIREVYDMNVINKVLNQELGKRYSQNLINLLVTMLQVEENRRPDFRQLETLLR